MSSPEINVRDGICQLIVSGGQVPTATLPTGAAAGATSIAVDNAANLREGGIVDWNDGTPEFPTEIDTITGNEVTLKFTGRSVTGLQYDHAPGALIATNLLRTPPDPDNATVSDVMASNGWPVWRVYTMDGATVGEAGRQMSVTHFCEIVHQLPAAPQRSPLQSDLYRQQQEERASADLDALKQAMLRNYTLPLDGVGTCDIIQRFLETSRGALYGQKEEQVALFERYLLIVVRGLDVTIGA
jgi:hypothetical protein